MFLSERHIIILQILYIYVVEIESRFLNPFKKWSIIILMSDKLIFKNASFSLFIISEHFKTLQRLFTIQESSEIIDINRVNGVNHLNFYFRKQSLF